MGKHAAPRRAAPAPRAGGLVHGTHASQPGHGRAATLPLRTRTGPVTAGLRIAQAPISRPWYAVACAWPLLPALFLIWPAIHGHLVLYADGVLGFDATLCLIACLAVTPLITITRTKITGLRWWFGLWVFVLGAAALAIHLAYPPVTGMPLTTRAAGTAVDWTGLLIVVLLLPMAATSSTAAQKMLGPEWKRWQRGLIWAVWLVIAIHFALLHAWLILIAYAGSTLPAILLRSGRVRRSIRTWRGGGYSTGGWWLALAVLGVVAAAGFLILMEEELIALVNAVMPVPGA